MKERGSNVKNFKQDFKEADIESGAQDKIAELYVNWSQGFAKSIVTHEGTLRENYYKLDHIKYFLGSTS